MIKSLETSTQNIAQYVPRLTEDMSITPFDRETFYIHILITDYRIRVNKFTKLLIDMIDGEKNLSQISENLESSYALKLEPQQIHKILTESLGKYGVLDDKALEVTPREDAAYYLKLKFTLFKQGLVNWLCQPFTYFFSDKFFYPSLLSMLIIACFIYFTRFSFFALDSSITKSFLRWIPLVGLISILLHELGHAAACKRNGAKPGAIGFGFYLVFPVFFADVSDAWKLSKSKRLIVDLGGFYMQVLLNFSFLIGFVLTGNSVFFAFGTMYLINIFFNLLPFLRRDGYWALSDLLGVPNLKKKSNSAFMQVLKKPSIIPKIKNYKTVIMVLYGLLNLSFTLVFISIVLIRNPNSIIFYPINLFNYFLDIFQGGISLSEAKSSFYRLIVPTTFYLMIIRFSINKIQSRHNNKKHA